MSVCVCVCRRLYLWTVMRAISPCICMCVWVIFINDEHSTTTTTTTRIAWKNYECFFHSFGCCLCVSVYFNRMWMHNKNGRLNRENDMTSLQSNSDANKKPPTKTERIVPNYRSHSGGTHLACFCVYVPTAGIDRTRNKYKRQYQSWNSE